MISGRGNASKRKDWVRWKSEVLPLLSSCMERRRRRRRPESR
jgi:hypothetical protein